MAERDAPPDGRQAIYKRALEFAASACKVLAGMIGTAAALIAVLQAFDMWP